MVDRRIPEWLASRKNSYLSISTMATFMVLEGGGFRKWADSITPRLKSVDIPKPTGGSSKRYLIKNVWAASLAHGLRLVPVEDQSEKAILQDRCSIQSRMLSDSRDQISSLEGEIRGLKRKIGYGDTGPLLARRLIAATDPRPLPGVYFLLDKSGDVVYVGQSKNVTARLRGHIDKQYDLIKMIHVEDGDQRDNLEKELITLLVPKLNVQLRRYA